MEKKLKKAFKHAFRIINNLHWSLKAVIFMGCVVLVAGTGSLLSFILVAFPCTACLYMDE